MTIFKKNPFFPAFFTLLLSIGCFYAFKEVLPEKLFTEIEAQGELIAVDSLVRFVPPLEEGKEKQIFVPGLISFFQKLFTLEKDKKSSVRIAYFTDSMTENDMLVQDLRKSYQEKYGGQGIGFILLGRALSSISGYSIRHYYSPEWKTYSTMQRSPVPFGVSGNVSLANWGSAWTRYQAGIFPLVRPTLFYGQSNNNNARMTAITEKGALEPVILSPREILNKHTITPHASNLTIRFSNARNIPFYGVDFSDASGVNIDNFPTRSSTGLPLGSLNAGVVNAFQRELQYDLIILQFGANTLQRKYTQYDWYAEEMTLVVNHLRNCFPGASILIISAADFARKYGGRMKTDPTLASLIQAQKEYAHNTGAAFINLFELIGGEGTMVKWAAQRPSLVQADYVHFNAAGSKKVAGLIFEKLEEEYKNFKKQNNLYIENGKDGTIDE